MHAPTPWVVLRPNGPSKPCVVIDANAKPVNLSDHANLMFVCLAVNAHHKRAVRAARKEAR